jgi:hypothetical protein
MTVLYAFVVGAPTESTYKSFDSYSEARVLNRLTCLHVNIRIHKQSSAKGKVQGRLTDHEAQRLFLAGALAPSQHVFDLHAFFDGLAALALPVNEGARLAREVSLGEDIIREVSQVLTLEVRQIEADALGRGLGVSTVYVFVVHPDGHGDIHCVFMIIRSIHYST